MLLQEIFWFVWELGFRKLRVSCPRRSGTHCDSVLVQQNNSKSPETRTKSKLVFFWITKENAWTASCMKESKEPCFCVRMLKKFVKMSSWSVSHNLFECSSRAPHNITHIIFDRESTCEIGNGHANIPYFRLCAPLNITVLSFYFHNKLRCDRKWHSWMKYQCFCLQIK